MMNRILLPTFALIILLLSQTPFLGAEGPTFPCRVFGPGRQVGELVHPDLTEVSGMAASRLRNDRLWVINDSHNGPYLYAIGTTGNHLGRVKLKNAPNVDWEDLASFRWQGEAYLLVADFGDNRAIRKNCILYVLHEPKVNELMQTDSASVDWAWRIKFTYEDGPRDSESVAVDPKHKKILIVTKRKWPPQLYELRLDMLSEDRVHVARRLTTIDHIPEPSAEDIDKDPRFGRFASQPTAMDLSPIRRWAVVLSYKNAYLFSVHPEADWQTVFQQVPQTVELPRLRQAEAINFSADNTALFVTSEQRPSPLLRLNRIPECP